MGKKNQLVWKRLSNKEIGRFQQLMICMIGRSPDPYVTVTYSIPAGQCRKFLETMKSKSNARLSFGHLLNKLLALAIAESPVHNQILLNSRLYQMEGIHIANIMLLPGEEQAMTNLVLVNPHRKSLGQIAEDLEALRTEKLKAYEQQQGEFSPSFIAFVKFLYRSGLYRLLSEKRIFKTGFEGGMFSNITLSNQIYGGRPGTMTVCRSMAPLINGVVIHTSGTEKRACAEGDAIISKEILPLTVTYDHRVLHGIHAHNFGLALERIASDPEKYMA